MSELLVLCCEEQVHSFENFKAKGLFNLQERKSNEKGLIVDSWIDIHPESISVFSDDYTFARIFENHLGWSFLHC